MPSKKWIETTGWYIQTPSIQMHHRDDRYRNTTDGHDDVFDEVTQYNAVHSSKHRIKNSKECEHDPVEMCDVLRCNIKRHILFHFTPWNKDLNELSKTHKAIC